MSTSRLRESQRVSAIPITRSSRSNTVCGLYRSCMWTPTGHYQAEERLRGAVMSSNITCARYKLNAVVDHLQKLTSLLQTIGMLFGVVDPACYAY